MEHRYSRAGGNPERRSHGSNIHINSGKDTAIRAFFVLSVFYSINHSVALWIPACAGMTNDLISRTLVRAGGG